tara:strand:+ start:189 stop:410 length:222 start_codon:yes stop_codon:yes gene_type:complete
VSTRDWHLMHNVIKKELLVMIGKVLQALALGYLLISYLITLTGPPPRIPAGRDLVVSSAVFLLGWIIIRYGRK